MSQVRNANIASAATTYSERPAFRSDTCEWVTGALTMQNQTNTHTHTQIPRIWLPQPGRIPQGDKLILTREWVDPTESVQRQQP